ncbi:bifunctional proline dehydrogenase/L-glutamate gamma-semialdehyde dehydrogenase PutA [Hyphomonas sp. FCG-A18]|uniref:bifunctional proline dehydrogenase/L-glutamate gamma-semialdehyde dehydrogenase PutA n=1 Tax=Hyphomonas sp. FCG-A18 TaxID=3080019 RepID=UPI002B2AB9B7|nr:bifunctional proline dehydrogenase/L-glutamate gamma-semialdehyde dehydrogenase PutA [Hyphomonas sp. FCG-A18]
MTRSYLRDESSLVRELLNKVPLGGDERWRVFQDAKQIVADVRADKQATSTIDELLLEYGLSTEEGVTLMRLAEALIRTPDFATSRSLIRDKIGGANWSTHAGKSQSFLVNQATNGLRLTSAWVSSTGGTHAKHLLAKLGDQVMDKAVEQAMAIMGDHFVLGRDIEQALKRGHKAESAGFTHSFDMLGEAAHTMEDADAYFASYLNAIEVIAKQTPSSSDMMKTAGLSVKLSALHPRYEYAHRETCVPYLVDRLIELARVARSAGLWLNIDAEEADRLEISLKVFEQLLKVKALEDWPGLGLVIQAYQRRAMPVIDHVYELACSARRKIAVRLVKGAYWDMEIKRAQEMGLASYPVFTRKENTDVSYLACAGRLLDMSDQIFPQFATHNAHTAAAIAYMAKPDAEFEYQRLHGMGGSLHARLMDMYGARSRIYAPVGTHKDLLPYLVRRLLENGANSSFVNQLMDERVAIDEIVTDPIETVQNNHSISHPNIPVPTDILEDGRASAAGIDLTQSNVEADKAERVASREVHRLHGETDNSLDTVVLIKAPQDQTHLVGEVEYADVSSVDKAFKVTGNSNWASNTTASSRADILNKAAKLLEEEMDEFLELCVREAGKTLPDAVAEVREAIDFCRYYALRAQKDEIQQRKPLGTVACISPWNFPLAIFLGQVVASLSVGNTVVAKPAAQTPIIAARAVDLLYRAGIPQSALQLLIGNGAILGNAMTRHQSISGVCFTGSTKTAKVIARNLAEIGRPTLPLIAETGGLNAMIVDSTALLEQAVQDVIDSAFQSAGQRCSACRILCVQEDVYEPLKKMLIGAMDELVIGDPAQISTDVGPVIDVDALRMIEDYKREARQKHNVLNECELPDNLENGFFTAPILIEVNSVSDIEREIFGPVLHIVKFKSGQVRKLVDEINSLGFGLTLGLHTRLDSRVDDVACRAHVGNIYVNRNQIGAVVGVHPFGGEGLSGTGPKAGGPNYLFGLTRSDAMPHASKALSSIMAPPELPGQGAMAALKAAKKAAGVWQNLSSPAQNRLETVRFLVQPAAHLDTVLPGKLRLKYDLPGPTGETNSLRLFPRGVFLCFGGDDSEALLTQIALALAAGSSVIAVVDETGGAKQEIEAIHDRLRAKQIPVSVVSTANFIEGLSLINQSIDGLCADGHARAEIGAAVALRQGSILPILSKTDPIERFFHERTLTINTTAAGGNASLLALS